VVDKKRGRVRFNRLGGRKRGELYGGREAEISRSLKSTRVKESRDRESVEGSGISIKIVAISSRGNFFSFFLMLILHVVSGVTA